MPENSRGSRDFDQLKLRKSWKIKKIKTISQNGKFDKQQTLTKKTIAWNLFVFSLEWKKQNQYIIANSSWQLPVACTKVFTTIICDLLFSDDSVLLAYSVEDARLAKCIWNDYSHMKITTW